MPFIADEHVFSVIAALQLLKLAQMQQGVEDASVIMRSDRGFNRCLVKCPSKSILFMYLSMVFSDGMLKNEEQVRILDL